MERRVTRSLSNERQNRGQAHEVHHHYQAQPQLPHSNSRPLATNRANSNGLQPYRGEPDSFAFEPLRTTSEEILIRTLVDGAITQSTPSMDGLGLSSLPLASRRNSEELFSTWLDNQDEPSATTSPNWNQQAFGSVSNDTSMVIPQQVTGSQQHLNSQQQHGLQTNFSFSHAMLTGKPLRTDGENIPSATCDLNNLQTLPWFQQARPMTRSRSAELRQMYAAMQGLPSADTVHRLATQGTHGLNQAVASLGAFARGLANGCIPQSPQVAYRPQSSNTVVAVRPGNSLSNMVSMLRGSLERKKLVQMNQKNEPTMAAVLTSGLCPEQVDPQRSAPSGNISADGEAQNGCQLNLGGNNSISHPKSITLTREVSPCESSGGAPTLSTGVALSDGLSNSGMVPTKHNTLKRSSHLGGAIDQPSKKLNNEGSLHSPGSHKSGDGSFEGFPKVSSLGKKPEQLTRVGSLISSGRSGLGLDGTNPTKMRRVERREKMLEAKGRPVLPSDLQVAMKRCDALEKEVRSLKLTVSFMNRKDSEQTKRIEELEKQNQELQHEKERLLEEVERLASGHHF